MEARPRYDAKLDRVLSAAARVFADRGFHRASVRDVAAEAEVSLSGLYYYCNSKEELLYLIQKRSFETLLDELNSEAGSSGTPEEDLSRLVRTHLRFFLDHMPEMKVISHEGESLKGEYDLEVRRLKRAYTRRVSGLIERLRPDDPSEAVRVATFALFGQLNWLYTWYRPSRDPGLERLSDWMTELLLHGLLGPTSKPNTAT